MPRALLLRPISQGPVFDWVESLAWSLCVGIPDKPAHRAQPSHQPNHSRLISRSRAVVNVWMLTMLRVHQGRSISGLVVEYIVAIDVTRVRFPADAFPTSAYRAKAHVRPSASVGPSCHMCIVVIGGPTVKASRGVEPRSLDSESRPTKA